MIDKLNVGCGNEILKGYINLDVARLDGVDVAHDLTKIPWPFEDGTFKEVRLVNVLEHLPDIVETMEEIWRISEPGCKVVIRVPYWNSWKAVGDPTHKTFFHEKTFEFFDPSKTPCRERPYYSHARFKSEKLYYWIPLWPFGSGSKWVKIKNPLLKLVLHFFALYLSNIIWMIELELRVLKNE